MWQRWRSRHSIRHVQKRHATRKRHGWLCFVEPELFLMEFLHCGNRDFRPFLLLWPWPWLDHLHIRTWPVLPGDIYWICKYKFPTLRLSKVIVWHTCRQTDTTEIIYHAASRVAALRGWPLRGWSVTIYCHKSKMREFRPACRFRMRIQSWSRPMCDLFPVVRSFLISHTDMFLI